MMGEKGWNCKKQLKNFTESSQNYIKKEIHLRNQKLETSHVNLLNS